ncbi:hypothetical protein ISCGN_019480 [Ixodes scapularis]
MEKEGLRRSLDNMLNQGFIIDKPIERAKQRANEQQCTKVAEPSPNSLTLRPWEQTTLTLWTSENVLKTKRKDLLVSPTLVLMSEAMRGTSDIPALSNKPTASFPQGGEQTTGPPSTPRHGPSDCKKQCKSMYEDMEAALLIWSLNACPKGGLVSGPILAEQARDLTFVLKHGFTPGTCWLQRLKRISQ